mgnify:CR=1 FL=1
MRVSSLVGAAEDAPPLLAPTLVGADVLGGPLHPPVLPLASPSPPSHLPLASKNIKKREKACQRTLSCAYTQMVELVSTKPKRCPGASVSCFYNSRT